MNSISLSSDYLPCRFYRYKDQILYLVEYIDSKEQLLIGGKDEVNLGLDLLSINQLYREDDSVVGYLFTPKTLAYRVCSTYFHVGIHKPSAYNIYFGLPGIQIYLGENDLIVVSMRVTTFYELLEKSSEMGYENPKQNIGRLVV